MVSPGRAPWRGQAFGRQACVTQFIAWRTAGFFPSMLLIRTTLPVTSAFWICSQGNRDCGLVVVPAEVDTMCPGVLQVAIPQEYSNASVCGCPAPRRHLAVVSSTSISSSHRSDSEQNAVRDHHALGLHRFTQHTWPTWPSALHQADGPAGRAGGMRGRACPALVTDACTGKWLLMLGAGCAASAVDLVAPLRSSGARQPPQETCPGGTRVPLSLGSPGR